MALNVCNWSDKQLDELVDMLKSADFSAVATFIANNFLCSGSRIMTDDISSTLRATVGVDTKTIVLSAGTFVHASKCSQLDSNQTVNILDTATGTWGTGQAVDAQPRYSIVCVKNNEQAHTAANRWFVNDSVVPNTYAQASTNTLLNKAYYDIVVVHGTPAGSPVVPAAPAGYWAIVEIYIPNTAVDLSSVGVIIYDTTDTSQSTVGPEVGGKNWLASTRVLRMEFWSTTFNIDHDPTTGYHRAGLWHIGATAVTATGTEINQALSGIGATVTAGNLTTLTDGSIIPVGSLHSHGGGSGAILKWLTTPQLVWNTGGKFTWSAIDISAYTAPDTAKGALLAVESYCTMAGSVRICFRKTGSGHTSAMSSKIYAWTYISTSGGIGAGGGGGNIIVECSAQQFDILCENAHAGGAGTYPTVNSITVYLVGYFV